MPLIPTAVHMHGTLLSFSVMLSSDKLFNCDCETLLFELPNESVDLIYCDILYGTGKSFKDYKDIKADPDIIQDFYKYKFTEMWRILKETGSIYLQMNHKINHWIRILMDDIFQYNNFRNEIIVPYNIGGYGKREFAKKHDVILVYSKSDNYIFNSDDIRVPYKSVVSSPNAICPNISWYCTFF